MYSLNIIMLSRASLLCRRRPAVSKQRWQCQQSYISCLGTASASNDDDTSTSTSYPHLPCTRSYSSMPSIPIASLRTTGLHKTNQTQIRTFAGRKDRASTSTETRPSTKKQRKTYHRRRRALEYEQTKHSAPNSKAVHRRREARETNDRLIEIAQEEEELKKQLAVYWEKVHELQAKIESSPKFQALISEGKWSQEQIKGAARDAAKKAAEMTDTPHPPLPSWWQERMTYDWGDALIDDLMGNSADLTSSPSPYPVYMGGEYGRLRRKVERLMRGQQREVDLQANANGGDSDNGRTTFLEDGSLGVVSPSVSAFNKAQATDALSSSWDANNNKSLLPDVPRQKNTVSDKLISDLLRAHRDAHGKRTNPVGLAQSLELLNELQIPLSKLGTYSHVSLLTCCKNAWEGRKVDELRKQAGVRSNEYFWSSFVDVYARSGDYRGAENVLDEMLEASELECNDRERYGQRDTVDEKISGPIAIPPLPAYTSFFSACYKLVSRPDVHASVKSDAANRAWARWKEMRIHGVAPDVMAYGALMRVYSAQGRAEQAIDLLEEIMDQMMRPTDSATVLNGRGTPEEVLKSMDGDENGWYDDRDGKRVLVKPTTLIFTSALKAVVKSHEIANRFGGGKGKKNRKREATASYHGRLTRQIVILAEQCEVNQDDGFVSALMLCAAAAGDSSTARAVYLASKVRRMDHLRTCGGKEHLQRLQGLIPEEDRILLEGGGSSTPAVSSGSGNVPALRSIEDEFMEEHQAYEHREYGNDTRIFNALLLAHSRAMEQKGLGSMWKGRYNRGYLCQNSLRYLEAFNLPQYENLAIPGLDSVKAGLSEEGWEPEDFNEDGKSGKQLRKKHKFSMQKIMNDGEGNRLDDMDAFFDGMDMDPEERRRRELKLLYGDDPYGTGVGQKSDDQPLLPSGEKEEDANDASRDWLNDRLMSDEERQMMEWASGEGIYSGTFTPGQEGEAGMIEGSGDFDTDSNDADSDDDDLDFKTFQQRKDRDELVRAMTEATNDPKLAEQMFPETVDLGPRGDDDDDIGDDYEGLEDALFDEDEFNKLMEDTARGMDHSKGGDAEELASVPGVSTNDFTAFRDHLANELHSEGAPDDVNEDEARQLFDMMRTYYDESENNNAAGISDAEFDEAASMNGGDGFSSMTHSTAENDINGGPNPQMQRISPDSMNGATKTMYADDYIEWANQTNSQLNGEQAVENNDLVTSENEMIGVNSSAPPGIALPRPNMSPLDIQEEDPHITELKQALPGLPMRRIEKVSDCFAGTLGYPSILKLTVAVREVMPEAFGPQCLVRKNLANAQVLVAEAEKEGLVDAYLLNGMLRVYTNSGRIEPALRFYNTEFKKHGMKATTHSDRLLFEMLIDKKRISRAYKLKQDIEEDGRKLDLLSYGSLVQYYGRRNQLGSALLLIKECISVHGSPPGEKALKNVRQFCRTRNLTEEVGLEKMIGKDPTEYLREGIRQKTKKGKHATSAALQYGMNRMVDI